MFLLVWESAYLVFPCLAHGKLYCHENGDRQINWDELIKFQNADRDTLKEKNSPQKRAAISGFAAFFVTILRTAALHSKDIKHLPQRKRSNKEVCGGQEEVIRMLSAVSPLQETYLRIFFPRKSIWPGIPLTSDKENRPSRSSLAGTKQMFNKCWLTLNKQTKATTPIILFVQKKGVREAGTLLSSFIFPVNHLLMMP